MDSKNREEIMLIFNDLFDRSSRQESASWPSFAAEKLKMLAQSHGESILLGKSGAALKEQLDTELRHFLTTQFEPGNPTSSRVITKAKPPYKRSGNRLQRAYNLHSSDPKQES